jgi:TolB protein
MTQMKHPTHSFPYCPESPAPVATGTGRRRLAALLGAAALAMFAGFAATPARAAIEININQGVVQPLPIAVSDFATDGANAARFAADIPRVVRADLERSGLFRPINPQAYIQKPGEMWPTPRMQDWRVIAAQALVHGRVLQQANGKLRIEYQLWDVFSEQRMTGVALEAGPEAWRRIAHKISDEIYKRITGEEGYFDTRVVYIAESGPPTRRVKRLALMDQDGENHRFLTDGRFLVLTPRFSPGQQEITFLSYFNDKPRVYLFNIDTGQQELVGDFPGMTFAPRFSPDGNKVAMSLAVDGNSDIYIRDLRTRQQTRLTSDPSIDTSPSYAPDGNRITFNSDRSGTKQIYVMDATGGNQKRISFDGSSRYATPVWSPRGDLIAFTKEARGNFAIGVMRPDGTGERILSTSADVQEAPTWAPNGRVLMFYREISPNSRGQGGRVRLWSIDLTGYNEREVLTPGDGSDPAWSPLTP